MEKKKLFYGHRGVTQLNSSQKTPRQYFSFNEQILALNLTRKVAKFVPLNKIIGCWNFCFGLGIFKVIAAKKVTPAAKAKNRKMLIFLSLSFFLPLIVLPLILYSRQTVKLLKLINASITNFNHIRRSLLFHYFHINSFISHSSCLVFAVSQQLFPSPSRSFSFDKVILSGISSEEVSLITHFSRSFEQNCLIKTAMKWVKILLLIT